MVAWGLLSRGIADRLQISTKTVEAHKANAMNKLELANRIDVVRYALLRGWLQASTMLFGIADAQPRRSSCV